MKGRVIITLLTAAAAFALVLVADLPPARSDDNVGSETCGTCHKKEYEIWRRSAHARATRSLPSAFRRDPRCASCHATNADASLSGVGCESCHGAGRSYYPDYVMRDPVAARAMGLVEAGKATCAGCHGPDSPSLRPFDYDKAWKRIAHGAPPK